MNYLMFNGVKHKLTADDEIKETIENGTKLSDIEVGETCKIKDFELIVCDHTSEGTVLLWKNLYHRSKQFGSNNKYNGSNIDNLCNDIADELAKVVGIENIVTHTVDLTADDGLRDYGTIERHISLLTANQCRKYVGILDKYKIDTWWWTATPYSTPKHDNDYWVKCVAPSGDIGGNRYFNDCGVRPFCILKSNIFVSK